MLLAPQCKCILCLLQALEERKKKLDDVAEKAEIFNDEANEFADLAKQLRQKYQK